MVVAITSDGPTIVVRIPRQRLFKEHWRRACVCVCLVGAWEKLLCSFFKMLLFSVLNESLFSFASLYFSLFVCLLESLCVMKSASEAWGGGLFGYS